MHSGSNKVGEGNEKYCTSQKLSFLQVLDRLDLKVSEGSEEDFPQGLTTNCEQLHLKSFWLEISIDLISESLRCWWLCSTPERRSSSWPLSCLCAVIEGSCLTNVHTQALNERSWRRAGPGLEGWGPHRDTQLWCQTIGPLIVWTEKVSTSVRVGAFSKFPGDSGLKTNLVETFTSNPTLTYKHLQFRV